MPMPVVSYWSTTEIPSARKAVRLRSRVSRGATAAVDRQLEH